MLEFAAKAAGYKLVWKDGYCKGGAFSGAFIDGKDMAWNPRADDGDALRLAVKMGFLVDTHGMHARVCFPYEAPIAYETKGSDPCATTRLAITRAAAEIGKNMEDVK